ncbi:zinc transporter 9-like [Silurus meridionalis]|uniref:zinc transporter 9-like n=1 Tax=Silurus meridionalis TaxID=175797 RepID=UPI001EEB14F5|nr:zinc transporter 9-like [Silurus meridionalis]
MESLLWAFCILAGSFVSEGVMLTITICELRRNAQKIGLSFYKYVKQIRDRNANVVLLEDAAAVLGVVISAGCMGLTSLTGLDDLLNISDVRKTVIINNELLRLKVDIATLQETCLAESGFLKEKDTLSSGKVRALRNVESAEWVLQ